MLSLIKLLNTNVYDNDGNKLGVLNDVALNAPTGKCVLITDIGVYTADNVTATREGVALSNPQIADMEYASLLGKSVYDSSGKHIGILRNIKFNKTLTLCKCICDNGEELTRRRLQAIDDIIIVRTPKPKTDKTAQQNKTEKEKDNIVSAQQQANDAINEMQATPRQVNVINAARETSKQTKIRVSYPAKRRYGDFNFLLGKVADKNITNFFNEVMIRRGEVVTKDVLRQAKISGKLIELCLHVK